MTDNSSGTHSPLWNVEMPEYEEELYDSRRRFDDSVELSPGPFFCMPDERDIRD
jgi:hypothetical protein